MIVHTKKSANGKNLRAARAKIDAARHYSLTEAVSAIQSAAYAKFDETLEVVMKLGVDPRHSDQMVRGVVALPFGTGKSVRVAVICKEDKVLDATAAGADIASGAELIEDIKAGKIDFDVCIASPDMMGLVGQVARILGPKGLMPNPKLGTVTTDIAAAVKAAKSGQVEFRVEKAGIIHAGVGKLSFTHEALLVNTQTLISAVVGAKPSGAKGAYVKGIYLSSTMGPSVKVDMSATTL
jgi:large subunit ribosomal protein L1